MELPKVGQWVKIKRDCDPLRSSNTALNNGGKWLKVTTGPKYLDSRWFVNTDYSRCMGLWGSEIEEVRDTKPGKVYLANNGEEINV